MKRLVLAAVVVAAFGRSAHAQPVPAPPAPAPTTALPSGTVFPPPIYPPSTPPPPAAPIGVHPTLENAPVGAPAPNVFVPPGTPPGPAIPFVKSGGLVVGVYGYYPYDTGRWLLGGTDGVTRQSGAFTMVYPESTGVAVGAGPVSRGVFHGRTRGFLCR